MTSDESNPAEASDKAKSPEEIFAYLKPKDDDPEGLRLWKKLMEAINLNNATGEYVYKEFHYLLPTREIQALRQNAQDLAVFEALFPEGSVDRLEFELEWQEKIKGFLDEVKKRASTPDATVARLRQSGFQV